MELFNSLLSFAELLLYLYIGGFVCFLVFKLRDLQ